MFAVVRLGKFRRATVSGGFEAGGRTNPYCDMIVSIKFLPEELQLCRECLQICFCPDAVCQGDEGSMKVKHGRRKTRREEVETYTHLDKVNPLNTVL